MNLSGLDIFTTIWHNALVLPSGVGHIEQMSWFSSWKTRNVLIFVVYIIRQDLWAISHLVNVVSVATPDSTKLEEINPQNSNAIKFH